MGQIGRASGRLRLAVAAVAVAVAAVRLPFLPATPDDLDAANFVLGLRDFDVARHQPHPPGYPLYIALGKAVRFVIPHDPGSAAALESAANSPSAGANRSPHRGGSRPYVPEAVALALLSALFSPLAVVGCWMLFRRLEGDERRGLTAMLVAVTCPLFWFTASRPLSDVPGLAAALGVQALLAAAFARQRPPRDPPGPAADDSGADMHRRLAESGRLIVVAALLAGLAVGLRAQTTVLTLPLLALVVLDRVGRDAAGALLGSAVAFGIGVLVWAVPLVVASGGAGEYIRVLMKQAGEDFAGVEMLATRPSLRGFVFALRDTFVAPWVSPALAASVLVAAGLGAAALGVQAGARAALVVLGVGFVPYAVFHLLYHEVVTVRYALPLVPPVAYLAISGVDRWMPRLLPAAVVVWAGTSLVLATPAVVASGRTPSPLYQALADLQAAVSTAGETPPVVAWHHSVELGLRGEVLSVEPLPALPGVEWLEVARYWERGGRGRVWFLADTRRGDASVALAWIDPATRQLCRSYRWPSAAAPLLAGSRPWEIDLYEFPEPGWVVLDGWALTPEMAGIGTALARGLGAGPIAALVRRRPTPVRVLIGGRNLGGAADPAVRFEASLDERPFAEWTVAPGFFLRVADLSPEQLAGDGRYAQLTIRAEAADRTRRPVRAAIEQFDAQPITEVVYGFDAGWHELEYNPATRRLWRWTSAAADVRIWSAGHDVRLRIQGESPLRYFATSPIVTLRAGSQILGRWTPAGDFDWVVDVPAAVLERAGGRLTLATTRVFIPAERSRSLDRRLLGLRIWSLTVHGLPPGHDATSPGRPGAPGPH